jgi:mRNA turnover protein 4
MTRLKCAVNLTKVKKKTREWKGALIDKVRKLCDDYPNVYVFKYRNMRNDRFKELREVRQTWEGKDSRSW